MSRGFSPFLPMLGRRVVSFPFLGCCRCCCCCALINVAHHSIGWANESRQTSKNENNDNNHYKGSMRVIGTCKGDMLLCVCYKSLFEIFCVSHDPSNNIRSKESVFTDSISPPIVVKRLLVRISRPSFGLLCVSPESFNCFRSKHLRLFCVVWILSRQAIILFSWIVQRIIAWTKHRYSLRPHKTLDSIWSNDCFDSRQHLTVVSFS